MSLRVRSVQGKTDGGPASPSASRWKGTRALGAAFLALGVPVVALAVWFSMWAGSLPERSSGSGDICTGPLGYAVDWVVAAFLVTLAVVVLLGAASFAMVGALILISERRTARRQAARHP